MPWRVGTSNPPPAPWCAGVEAFFFLFFDHEGGVGIYDIFAQSTMNFIVD
jgi:hypothetical protein